MDVKLSQDAVDDSLRADAWWKANRDEKECFQDELLDALGLLAHAPHVGLRVRTRRGDLVVRRLLLKKSRYLVFYSVDERAGLVEVLRIWQGNQGRAPEF